MLIAYAIINKSKAFKCTWEKVKQFDFLKKLLYNIYRKRKEIFLVSVNFILMGVRWDVEFI